MKQTLLTFITLISLITSATAAQKFRGKIYNMQGPNAAAWDLSNDNARYLQESDAGKDLINTTARHDKLPFFRRELKSGNGSLFVKLNTKKELPSDYAGLSHLFRSSTSSDKINHVRKSDRYLVKKTNGDLIILTIVDIRDDRTSRLFGGNNLDCIQIEYERFAYHPPKAMIWNPEANSSETEEPSIVIFPNPVASELFISYPNNNGKKWKVKIESTKGELMYESLNATNESQWKQNLSTYPGGRYVVTLFIDEAVYLQKIIDKIPDNLSSSEVELTY